MLPGHSVQFMKKLFHVVPAMFLLSPVGFALHSRNLSWILSSKALHRWQASKGPVWQANGSPGPPTAWSVVDGNSQAVIVEAIAPGG